MNKKQTILSSSDILKCIARRHTEDIFISECKTGASGRGCVRLDAWAMRRSWVRQCYTGYEIKVSRSDFSRDDKWMSYLQHCNQFYFVCPWGMLKPEEIPGDVGLIYCAKSLERNVIKKKAAWRNIDSPSSIMQYILQSRSLFSNSELAIGRLDKASRADARLRDVEYFEKQIKDSKYCRMISTLVSGKLRKAIDEKIEAVEEENVQLKRDNNRIKKNAEGAAHIMEIIEDLGIDISGFGDTDRNVRRKVPQIIQMLDWLRGTNVTNLINALQTIEQAGVGESDV